ncbi:MULTISPECIES: hypothetical protein [unclassified Novosphingobium]|uniref:DUF7946 domain-containing protein n=1 Tax=unclassified Novosphingobium TaxID=2644732 RepID=UPI0025DCC7AA|nr:MULTISPECIES: hypothetical protein [unclassified Novosphingobium]HQS69645.1 hypothetical protein [Novosphingobium sp.]
MNEEISFTFDGKIAAQNKMDFYESARFQYSASRLLVKLDNFRKNGSFPKKITYKNTPDILILPTRRGSYGIDIIAPLVATVGPMVIEAPISAMLSYVIDRVFKSADDDTIREVLATQRELIQTFDRAIAGRDNTIDRTLDMLREHVEQERELNSEVRRLQDRIIADQDRRIQLAEHRMAFRQIDQEQEAELITMAAPLLKEMNVPLRRSASKVDIQRRSGDRTRNILAADKAMADAVETAVLDRRLTTIDINVVQFNKQSGWGKFENEEWEGLPTFSIPGDWLDDIKETVVNSMKEDVVEVDCYFVRSAAGVPQRIIIVDIRDIEEEI